METLKIRLVRICRIILFMCIADPMLLSAQQKPVIDKQSSVTDISFANDSIQLRPKNEVLINTGYSTQRRGDITGSVISVGSGDFNNGNINDPLQLVQGKIPGLDISKPGSDPNGSFYLRLRGLNTINSNTQPLIIIDGLVDASPANIDPNDIESFTVLRDGASCAIYGIRGANGVILITTKKAVKGTTRVDYNVYTSMERVAKNEPVMNAAQWRQLSKEVGAGQDFGFSTDWFKEIEQTAYSQVHNIAVSGGTDKTSYRASLNYRQGEGIEINTGYTQLNGRVNITQKAINDKFILDVNLSATDRESKYGFADAFRYASIANPTAPVKSDDPAYTQYDGYYQQVLFDYYNPVAILKLNTNEGRNRIVSSSIKGTYLLAKGLNIDAFYSVQYSGDLTGKYYSKADYWGGINRNGLASRSTDNYSNQLFESTFHYNNDNNSIINFSAMGGYSYQYFTNEGFMAEGGDFLTDDFTYNNLSAGLDFKNGKGTVASYKNSNKLIAFFGQANLSINKTYFLSVSARYDGSSRLSSQNKWGLFPSLGGGIDLTRALRINFLNYLKLRMDYGITGNQPASSYMSLFRLVPQGTYYYNGVYIPGYAAGSNFNLDLKGEKKSEFDLGFDFSLFKSRLSGSWDFYSGTSSDLLYQYLVPTPPNLYYYQWMNIGKIKSSGLELSLNINVINKPDFTYNVTLTRSRNLKNILVSLSGNYEGTTIKYGVQDMGDLGSPGGCCSVLIRSEEGKPIGQEISFVEKGIDNTGRYILVDQNKDGYINSFDWTVTGNGLPKSMAGLDNKITYKNWDIDIFFRGVFGYNLVNNYRAIYEAPSYVYSYNVPKSVVELRNSSGQLLTNTSGILTNRDVEKASFVSLNNISVGYNFKLPAGSQFNKIKVYLAGTNLFYLTSYSGPDPNPRYSDSEFSLVDNPLIPGIDRRNTWPRARSFTIGANVVF